MLLIKFNFIENNIEINDRNNDVVDDHLLIKLFKDYLFHQLKENDQVIVDFGHVVDSLNKLDYSSFDQILLISRDTENLLVVSFNDLFSLFSKHFNNFNK
jgi:PAB-dependent poly(A)-specific ribonuclease subunit 3